MDIEKIVKEALSKLNADEGLVKEFLANPVETLEKKLGIDLPDEQVNAVVTAIKAKLNVEDLAAKAGDVVNAAKSVAGEGGEGLLDKIKGIFGK